MAASASRSCAAAHDDGIRVAASGLSVAREPGGPALLEAVDLALRGGECVLVEGATGAGKSTLLRALAGMPGVAEIAGTIERRGPVALLGQHVETQLLCPTVGEEVALGLRRHGLADRTTRRCVERALQDVGLAGFATRETDALSAGQRQRVVLAALLALRPRTLLLDEPMAALDAPSRRRLACVLDRLTREGVAILVAEHSTRELLPVADRVLRIEGGRLLPSRPGAGPVASPREGRAAETAMPDRLDELPRATRWLVTGPNGAGKSTWLRTLARTGSSRGPVSLVIQEPRRGLFARTVRDEVGFGFDRLVGDVRDRDARIEALLTGFGLERFADRSPRRLSFGEQHRLAIAASLASRPAYLLLDEPFAGLDAAARAMLLASLARAQRATGVGIVIASHDRAPLEGWCDRVVHLAPEDETRVSGAPPARPGASLRPYALQFRSGHSWLHRAAPPIKGVLLLAVALAVLLVDSPILLVSMLGLVASGYAFAGLGAAALWRDVRWLLVQGVLLVGLTVALRGETGWLAGSRAALQIAGVFLPTMLFVRTTRMDAVLDALAGWLPERVGFAIGATLRFLPLFSRELGELVDMQRLRGARLGFRALSHPQAWRDALACVAVPMTLRAIEIANEAADAAWIRGIGRRMDPGEPALAAEED